jgi:hypothetical protein
VEELEAMAHSNSVSIGVGSPRSRNVLNLASICGIIEAQTRYNILTALIVVVVSVEEGDMKLKQPAPDQRKFRSVAGFCVSGGKTLFHEEASDE